MRRRIAQLAIAVAAFAAPAVTAAAPAVTLASAPHAAPQSYYYG